MAASKRFYVDRGLAVTKSFGRMYVEFATGTSPVKLALYRRRALAEDVGVSPDGTGSCWAAVPGPSPTRTGSHDKPHHRHPHPDASPLPDAVARGSFGCTGSRAGTAAARAAVHAASATRSGSPAAADRTRPAGASRPIARPRTTRGARRGLEGALAPGTGGGWGTCTARVNTGGLPCRPGVRRGAAWRPARGTGAACGEDVLTGRGGPRPAPSRPPKTIKGPFQISLKRPLTCDSFESGRQDLNLRPLDPQSSALPSCATSRCPSGLGFPLAERA